MEPVRLIVYSDYLCPWCYNATVRLRLVHDELGGAVQIDWRSFLLRPTPNPNRSREKFRAYTRSWMRPAAEPDAGTFRVWESEEGPPSHSIPPHLAAKAAAAVGPEAFERMHVRLLQAYFAENRDVTQRDTLLALWTELELPPAGFAKIDDPAVLDEVQSQHREAIELGIGGVPTVRVAGSEAIITGAHPVELYRRWVRRLLA